MKRSFAFRRMAGILSLVCVMILAVFMSTGRVRAEETDEIMPDNSLPVVYLDIDESQGTVEDMITSDEHSAYCYGTVSIEVPEGFHYSDFPDLRAMKDAKARTPFLPSIAQR